MDLEPPLELRELASGAKVCKAKAGGFGLVAVSRKALTEQDGRIAFFVEQQEDGRMFIDDDGHEKVAFFVEQLSGRKWLGEDLAFFDRLPPSVRVEALLTGRTAHAGQPLELGELLTLLGQHEQRDQKQDAPATLEAGEQG